MTGEFTRTCCVVALIAALVPAVAEATRISYRDVSLADAVSRAPVVVRALHRGAGSEAPFRFTVEEVLAGTGPARGEDIEVFRIETRAMSEAARAYRATGVRRSPRLPRLPAPAAATLVEGAEYCLLLSPVHSSRPGRYVFAVANGHVAAPCTELRGLLSAAAP